MNRYGVIEPVNEHNSGYEEDFIDIVKKFFNIIKNIPSKVENYVLSKNKTKNHDISVIMSYDKYNKQYYNLVNTLLQVMDMMATDLENNRLIDEELYDFLDIIIITKYTLTRKNNIVTKEDIFFVANLSEEFFKLIETKASLIPRNINNLNEWDENSKLEYSKIYNEFEDFLYGKQEYFYENIYVNNNNQYNESAIELSNILRE